MKDGMLEFKDEQMFGRVMRNEELCKQVLEVILNIEIDHIEYLNTEQEMSAYNDAKGVRLDVYLKASDKVFDIEMQTTIEPFLGKRIRYYQSSLDSTLLDRGETYDMLLESYVIFICSYDPYGFNIPIYTLERTCVENPDVVIHNDSHWLILNAKAWNKDTDKARSNLLQYIQSSKVGQDSLTQAISDEVDRNNSDSEWRRNAMGFMTVEHSHRVGLRAARQEGIEIGLAEGLREGEARNKALIDKLLADDRIDDLKRSTTDEAFCNQLYEEYGL